MTMQNMPQDAAVHLLIVVGYDANIDPAENDRTSESNRIKRVLITCCTLHSHWAGSNSSRSRDAVISQTATHHGEPYVKSRRWKFPQLLEVHYSRWLGRLPHLPGSTPQVVQGFPAAAGAGAAKLHLLHRRGAARFLQINSFKFSDERVDMLACTFLALTDSRVQQPPPLLLSTIKGARKQDLMSCRKHLVLTLMDSRIQRPPPSLLSTSTTRSEGGTHSTRRYCTLTRPPEGDGLAICRFRYSKFAEIQPCNSTCRQCMLPRPRGRWLGSLQMLKMHTIRNKVMVVCKMAGCWRCKTRVSAASARQHHMEIM